MNMEPEKMKKWATDNRATIFAPVSPTCNCSTLDYFIAHRSIADAVVGTQFISDLGGGHIMESDCSLTRRSMMTALG